VSFSELLDLVFRWVHLIAGIMWVGNSMLFNWIDRNLEKRPGGNGSGHIGDIWMVHSGGFYQMEKKTLGPGEMPKMLHWFKWQNGITWLSGMSLLVLIFYMGAKAMMVDPDVSSITPNQAVLISAISLPVAFAVYDLAWRSSIGKNVPLATLITIADVLITSWVYFHYFSGRAAYIHVGVLIGTLMTGNVWMVIVPSQRELIAATLENREQDPAKGYQAKQRSVHNNYFTFPLLFIMLSGHFPSTYSHPKNWLILLILGLSSAGIRWCMNMRFEKPGLGWLFPAGTIFFSTVGIVYALFADRDLLGGGAAKRTTPVAFAEAADIIHKRCTQCHSATPSDDTYKIAPNGVMFDTPEQIQAKSAQIVERAVTLRNMPLANITKMTPDERETLRAWVDQGAKGP
jgi:uncharacterized membrane protein